MQRSRLLRNPVETSEAKRLLYRGSFGVKARFGSLRLAASGRTVFQFSVSPRQHRNILVAKPKNEIPEKAMAEYEALVATHPDVERKGAKNPYTSVNGHMFSLLGPDGILGLRLSKDDRERFQATYDSPPFVQYGAVMRDYVTVPPSLLADTAALKPLFAASYDYVSGLKPKPTKKAAK